MTLHRQVTRLDTSEAAYIAGLIDGEGTVTLTRAHRNENRRLVVCISNNEIAILRFVKSVTGVGKITSKRRASWRQFHLPAIKSAGAGSAAADRGLYEFLQGDPYTARLK